MACFAGPVPAPELGSAQWPLSWRWRPACLEGQFPILLAGAFSVSGAGEFSYVQIYDLGVLSIAVAFLIKDGLSVGFLPGERTAILVCFAALFFLLNPVGPIVYALIVFLIARRLAAYRRDVGTQTPLALNAS